tara:strand:- start:236 stop:406 length:171 start_codon:yes stop_codon:yes gene_type:complete
VFAPVVEYAAVNIVFKVIKRKQHLFIQSINDTGSLFTLPVVAINMNRPGIVGDSTF